MKKNYRISLFLFTLILLLGMDKMNGQSWTWGRMAAGNSEGWTGIAMDADQIYYSGYFYNSITFGSSTLVSSGGSDAFLVKYDNNGNVQWARQSHTIGSTSNCQAFGMDCDEHGNVFMIGPFQGNMVLDDDTIQAIHNEDATYLIKYDPYGNTVWTEQTHNLSVSGFSIGNSITGDKLGNSYATGSFKDTVRYGIHKFFGSGNSSAFLFKLDSLGHLLWGANSVCSSSAGNAQGIVAVTDFQNNPFLIGFFTDTIQLGGNTLSPPNLAANVFVARFDPSGNVSWVSHSQATSAQGNAFAYGAETDIQGNLYVCGSFQDTVSFGAYTLRAGSPTECFLVKYDPAGHVVWARQSHTAQQGSSVAYSITTDEHNRIFLGGGSTASSSSPYTHSLSFGMDTISLRSTAPGLDPGFIAEFDSTGSMLCSSIIASGGDDNNAVTTDPTGAHVYLIGDLQVPVTFAGVTLDPTLNGGEVAFVARWEPCIIPVPEPECPEIYVPNTFTPNGDGMNELECVYGGCVEQVDFSIYNRWGEKVFESKDLKQCWDGTYAGKPMNSGVFVFYLTATLTDGRKVKQKGTINLIK
ncbi:MAG TPA: gliding motility-associated C-terminal domain-containing protein [Bacteroidia bacterium]|nr:gliding motility-associated C-terminal domain-containing protein [Bacteroidia bacterium]